MTKTKQKTGFRILCTFVTLCLFFGTSNRVYASVLLVNTEAFHVIDDTNSTANLYIQFGELLGKKITYDRTATQYNFDDDLEILGSASGRWLHAQDRLSSSGSLAVDGTAVYFNSFSNCTALETVNGLLTCGSDDTGAGGTSPGQGLTAPATGFLALSASHSGTTIEATTLLSGAIVHAQSRLSSSGSLAVDGTAVYFNSFSNCTALQTVNGLLTCGSAGGASPAQGLVSPAIGFIGLSATHSGTTIEGTTLLSGATVHAQNQLQSSGSLVAEGTTAFNNVQYTWPFGAASASGKVLKVNPANGQMSWSADLTGGGGASTVVSTANVSDTTTGGTNNVTGLTIPVSASTNYIIRCLLTTGAAATTTGVQITVNGPASPTQVTWNRQSCSSTTAIINAQINAFGTEDARTASAGATRCIEPIRIHLRNGANAGNVTFSVDTEVASSAATVYTGSFCDYQTY